MAGIQQTSFTSPGFDYGADLAEIERRRNLSKALQGQAMSPLEAPPTAGAGQFQARSSPWQGVAKLLQGYSGIRQEQKAQEEQKTLASKAQSDYQQMVAKGLRQLKGAPATPLSEDASGNVTPAQPAVAPDPTGAMATFGAHPMGQALMPLAMQELQRQGLLQALQGQQGAPNSAAGGSAQPSYGQPGFNPSASGPVPQAGGGPNLNLHLLTDPTGKSYVHALEQGGETSGRVFYDQNNQAFTIDKSGRRINIPGTTQGISPTDRWKLGFEGANTFFNTGQRPQPLDVPGQPSPMGAQPTQQPAPAGAQPAQQSAPQQQPAAAPQSPMPTFGLPPKYAAEVQADIQKKRGEMETKRQFNMGGINDTISEARRILQSGKPTSSLVGSAVDTAAGWLGQAPSGAAEADKLRALGGALVAKMPRMEGPQSDRDVLMYREMAGQVGDSSLPLSRRAAALDTVEQLWAKYEGGAKKAQSGALNASEQEELRQLRSRFGR